MNARFTSVRLADPINLGRRLFIDFENKAVSNQLSMTLVRIKKRYHVRVAGHNVTDGVNEHEDCEGENLKAVVYK